MEENKQVKSYYIENTKFNRIALSQVYDILIEYEDGIENIPENVIRFLDDNRDKEYSIFDYSNDLENFQLEKDAEDLLIYIYTKYLASEEERSTIEEIAQLQRIKEEKQKKEQFTNDIFNSKEQEVRKIEESVQENILPVEYKESILNKILRFFKNIFNRNKN